MKYQQGDVLMKGVNIDPTSFTKLKTLTLQEGEVTGHSHVVSGDAALYEDSATKQRFLQVLSESVVRHEEHRTITLPPGVYKIGIVREVDHLSNIIRRVVD